MVRQVVGADGVISVLVMILVLNNAKGFAGIQIRASVKEQMNLVFKQNQENAKKMKLNVLVRFCFELINGENKIELMHNSNLIYFNAKYIINLVLIQFGFKQ